jgi:hypothetical protein
MIVFMSGTRAAIMVSPIEPKPSLMGSAAVFSGFKRQEPCTALSHCPACYAGQPIRAQENAHSPVYVGNATLH